MPVYAEKVLTRGGLRTTKQERRREIEEAFRREPYRAMRRGLYDRAGLQPGRPKRSTQESDYRDYVKTLLGRSDIDLSQPGALDRIWAGARKFAGFDLDGEIPSRVPTKPTLIWDEKGRRWETRPDYGPMGRPLARDPKMARLRKERVEEFAPARRATQEYRERLLAGQRARSAVFAREREAAGGPIGTITTPEGVVIPERMYEQRQLEKRFPLGGSPAEAQARTGIETRRRRVEEIRAELGRTPPEEAGRLTLRGDISFADQRNALREEREKLEREIEYLGQPSTAPRPGERPTIQAHEYAAETLPLVQQQQAVEAEANRLGNAYMAATGEEKARLLTAWQQTEKTAKILADRIRAGPQAPSAAALGVEQAEIQAEAVRRAPEMAALETEMVGKSREAVEATRKRQVAEREAAAARVEPGLPIKPTTVTPAARLAREKWEREIKTALPGPIQDRLKSLERILTAPTTAKLGTAEYSAEQRSKAAKDYAALLRKLEKAGKLPKGTADLLAARADINQVADALRKTLDREPTGAEVKEALRKRTGG